MTHFQEHDNFEEAYEPTPIPVWRWGMWFFLASEIAVFGGMLTCFILFRWRNPAWAMEASQTLRSVGWTINTVILLTSSLTMILAHHFALGSGGVALSGAERAQKASRYLLLTLLLGLCFLTLNPYEYVHEIESGLVPSKSLFWGFYFLMTGLHALHMIAGLIANFIVFLGVRKNHHLQRVEAIGLYWHFVDLVWIFLFPYFI